MLKILEICKVILYADDVLMYTVVRGDTEWKDNMKFDVQKISECLKINKLNENKTKIVKINILTNYLK